MTTLENLKDTTRTRKSVKRVGRGPGSGLGKTCGRGEKGAGARSGYKRRYGYEGGQFPLYRKVPCRGFSNASFRREYEAVNLEQIDRMFEDGDVVNAETLAQKGFISGRVEGVKLLGNGELTKKVTIELHAISKTAKEKLQVAKISFTTCSNQV
jgi:large subunit ribosomal protein L15